MLGVIGILIGIIIPTLGKVRRQSMRLACAAQMRELGRAVQMYRQQEEVLPFFAFGLPPAPLLERTSAELVLKPYVDDAEFIRCPSDDLDPPAGFEWLASSYDYWPGRLMNFDLNVQPVGSPRQLIKERSNKTFTAPFGPVFTETEARHDGGHNRVMAPDWRVTFED